MMQPSPAPGKTAAKDDAFIPPIRLMLRRLVKNKMTMISLLLLALITAACFLGPLVYRVGTADTDLMHLKFAPTAEHPFGTDEVGRDVLARLLEGGQVSLTVGILAALMQMTIGISVGLMSGYLGGVIDGILMRIVDIVMCFPFFVIAISMAAILGPSTKNVILIIGVLHWGSMARLVRAETLSMKGSEYVTAARALGVSSINTLLTHVFPGVFPKSIVIATTDVSVAILSEAALSFLGMGVQAPQSSWGSMLSTARSLSVLQYNWWMWLPAGLLIVLTAVCVNLLGNAMRDAVELGE